MDKYHIYEEVGTGAHSQVFKGREKMDIAYVAIKRVEKCMMNQVINEVQVIHRLSSPNVLKFYDWYETRNNVWLILEFCTGGDLLTLIKQDHREPESAVRLFGVDLLAGLQQTHARGFLHGDLKPSNVLIDEYGILKLSGFGLARSIPGTVHEAVPGDAQGPDAAQGNDQVTAAAPGVEGSKGDSAYMAPELFSAEGMDRASFASDFWSLGCVLFQLLTGEPPFGTSSTSSCIEDRIKREDPPGLNKGEWQGSRMSPDFCNLVGWLLNKDPLRRPTWPQLLAHPFWGNCQTPVPLEMPAQPRFDRALALAASTEASASPRSKRLGLGSDHRETLSTHEAREQAGPGERGWGEGGRMARMDEGGHQSSSQARGAPNSNACQKAEDVVDRRRGGSSVAHANGDEATGMNEPGYRRQERTMGPGGGDEAAVRDNGDCADENDRRKVVLSDLGSPVRGTQGDTGRGGGTERVGHGGGGRRSTPSRNSPKRTEPEGSGKGTGTPDPTGGQQQRNTNGYIHLKEHGGRKQAAVHVAKETTAAGGSGTKNSSFRQYAAGGHRSTVPAADVSEQSRAPSHGYGSGGGAGISEAAMTGGAINLGAARGGGRPSRAGAGVGDVAARRAAALDSLRLRGKIPPIPQEGRGSPPRSASASSSVGEMYGSSFEEDTEGSSSYSVGAGSSEGAGIDAPPPALTGAGAPVAAGAVPVADVPSIPDVGSPSISTSRYSRGLASGVTRDKRSGTAAGAATAPAGKDIRAHPVTPPPRAGRRTTTIAAGSVAAAAAAELIDASVSPGYGTVSRLETSPVTTDGSPSRSESGLGSESGDAASGLATLSFETGTSMSLEHGPTVPWTPPPSHRSSTRVATPEAQQWRAAAAGDSDRGRDESIAHSGGQSEQRRAVASQGGRMGAAAVLVETGEDGGKADASAAGTLSTKGKMGDGRCSPERENDGRNGRRGTARVGGVQDRDGYDDGNEKITTGSGTGDTSFEARDGAWGGMPGVQELLLHPSDAQVTPIVGNRSIEPFSSSPSRAARSSRDQLTFEAFLPGTVAAMSLPDLEAHLTVVYNVLDDPTAPVRRRGQTLLYLQSLTPIPQVSNLILNTAFLVLLLRLLRKPRPAALRNTIAALLSRCVRHATYIVPTAGQEPNQPLNARGGGGGNGSVAGGQKITNANESQADGDGHTAAGGGGLVGALVATIRERPAPGRAEQAAALRRNAMAALGELLFYVVSQEPAVAGRPTSCGGGGRGGRGGNDGGGGSEARSWHLPITAVGGAIEICLEDAAHDGVCHYAAKTLENVLAQAGPSHPLVGVLVTQTLALCLFDLARNASSESLRTTAMAGLSHLLGHDVLGGECEPGKSVAAPSLCANADVVEDGRGKGREKYNGRRTSYGADWRRAETRSRRSWPGQITSRVMCEPGAAMTVINGLSEVNSSAYRRALLNIFNLVLWCSSSSSSVGKDSSIGGGESSNDQVGGKSNLQSVAKTILESQMLLPRLLRTAEHGEGIALRSKGFLALHLVLEAAPPDFLLKACRSRMLPLLARVIGALAPRAGHGAGTAATPGLSPAQNYLYQCCNKLADWLCAIPENAARRLEAVLRRRKINAGAARDRRAGTDRYSGSEATGRQAKKATLFEAKLSMEQEEAERMEVATSAFPAVVHLINSPLLRTRAVTGAFVRDVAACIAFSCPIGQQQGGSEVNAFNDAVYCLAEGEMAKRGSALLVPGAAAVSPDEGTGDSTGVALAALLPTVEALAQQAEAALLPHWEIVADKLLPVLCRLLRSPSGDTRALAVAVLRVLLPPLLRPVLLPQLPFLHRITSADGTGNATPSPARPAAATVKPGPATVKIRSAIATHLLPLLSILLRDHAPIPQYVIRLLVDVAREWDGLGPALLATGDAIPALLDRLPPPTKISSSSPQQQPPPPPPRSASPASPWPPAAMYAAAAAAALDVSPAGGRHRLVETGVNNPAGLPGTLRRHNPGVTEADKPVDAAALDPAMAALITRLIERDDGGGVGGGGDREALRVTLLRLELPGKVAAGVVCAVAAGVPEATEAFLALAVVLFDAAGVGRQGERDVQRRHSSGDGGRERRANGSPPPTARVPEGRSLFRTGSSSSNGTGSGAHLDGNGGVTAFLEPLLSAAPSAAEGMQLFCVRGGVGEQEPQQLIGSRPGRAGIFVDDGLRAGVSDSATAFLALCYQAFHERLLRILFLPKAPPPTTKNAPATTHSAPAARACRQFADFLGCPHIDERSRLRALRLLLAAARNGYYASALGNGPLWTALLRLASGRIATTVAAGGSGGGSRGGGGATSGGGAGATQALARDVVASVRGGWGHDGGGGWDGRAGGRRLFGGRGGIRNDGIR